MPTMPCILGIDVGSSSTKVGLFGLGGAAIAQATYPCVTHEPRPGFKEQDPESWWDGVRHGIGEVTRSLSPKELLAVGVTGHISSLTFVDASGRLLRPAIGFQDLRAVEELNELQASFSRDELAQRLGIDLPPAATWPLPRLLWLKKHEPATLEAATCLLQAKDFVNYRLTGELAGDASSFRGLVNFATGRAAEDILASLGLPARLLPPLSRPDAVIGTVTDTAAKETGLPAGLPVVAGCNDLNASVLGSGATREGDSFNITGTSEHLGIVTTEQHRAAELICAPYLPGSRLFYGVTSSGGGSLAWLERVLEKGAEELLAMAGAVPPGAGSLLFLPYLEGERSPVWDPRAAGAFVGLRTRHRPVHLARAVLEGVAFSLRQISELVEQAGADLRAPINVSGGAARARLWNQIKADVLGRAVIALENPQSGMLGAAMLAAVGTGYYKSCEEAAQGMVRRGETLAPNPDNAALYSELYGIYCQLYPALREPFADIHAQRCATRDGHA